MYCNRHFILLLWFSQRIGKYTNFWQFSYIHASHILCSPANIMLYLCIFFLRCDFPFTIWSLDEEIWIYGWISKTIASDLGSLMSVLWKCRVKTWLIHRQAWELTVIVPLGGWGETHIWEGTDLNTTPALSICSLLFYHSLYHYLPSSPPLSVGSSVADCPQLFQLFNSYLGIVTRENYATSCFGCAMADSVSFCRNGTLWEKNQAFTLDLQGTTQYTDGVILQQPLHWTISTLEWYVKAK